MRDVHPEIVRPRHVVELARVRRLAIHVHAQLPRRFDRDPRQLRVAHAGLAEVLAALDLEDEPGKVGTPHRLHDAEVDEPVGYRGTGRHESAAAGGPR